MLVGASGQTTKFVFYLHLGSETESTDSSFRQSWNENNKGGLFVYQTFDSSGTIAPEPGKVESAIITEADQRGSSQRAEQKTL